MILSLHGILQSGGAGIAAANSPEAQAYFDRLIPYPSTAREAILSAFIDGLVAEGIDDRLDFLHINCHINSGSALTNVFAAAPQAVEYKSTGGLTFTVDEYWSGGGSGHHISANFNPSSFGGSYTQNDAMLGCFIPSTTQVNQVAIFSATIASPESPLSKITLYPRWSDGNAYWTLNGSADVTTAHGETSDGLWIMQRTASDAQALYRNAALLGSSSQGSTSLDDAIVRFRCTHATSLMFGGGSLDSTQRAAFSSLASTLIAAMAAHPA